MNKYNIKIDKNNQTICPCDSGKTYSRCCQPLVGMHENAATAEALMRSRYTAFVLLNEKYLRYSWHPDTCPKYIRLDENTKWLGLKIKKTLAGAKKDDVGEVEFIARNKTINGSGINGKAKRIRENSRFTRYENRWVYLDGK